MAKMSSKSLKKHKEPDADDRGGKSDNDADDKPGARKMGGKAMKKR
jgi:hypothetical protein